jgi:hypothetical protein
MVSPVRFATGLPLAMLWVLCALPAPWVVSAENESTPAEVPTEQMLVQQSVTEDGVGRIHELGYFHILQLRPTRDETINVKFELHLRIAEDVPGPELENRLNRWTARLCDQVITAVRNAETKDFTEPQLRRLQKLILLRVNRLLQFTRIEEIYLTQYEFLLL